MIFIGIDPGLNGGIAALSKEGQLIVAENMPTMPSPVAGKNMVDPNAMAWIMRGIVGRNVPVRCAIERVGAMPGQGVSSMFSFGTSYGIAIGVIAISAYDTPVEHVLPAKWKKHHGIGKDKDHALGLAMRKWPALKLKKKDDGVAEALLIADWLRVQP